MSRARVKAKVQLEAKDCGINQGLKPLPKNIIISIINND